MRILFLGDVVGRTARHAIINKLSSLRRSWKIDFAIANCENATQGRGVTLAHARTLLGAGIDCITLGDHAFDQKQLVSTIASESRLLRPLNLARTAPGAGMRIYLDERQRKILVMTVLGRVFMAPTYDDPFERVQRELEKYRLGAGVSAIVVDFHAEATSEKMAMGNFCDGRATLVAGTHTHVPTSDFRVLDNGTAYISDVGMCGCYNSVIGMDSKEPLKRFVTGMKGSSFSPSAGETTICGVIVESNDASGLATSIIPVRVGGFLHQAAP